MEVLPATSLLSILFHRNWMDDFDNQDINKIPISNGTFYEEDNKLENSGVEVKEILNLQKIANTLFSRSLCQILMEKQCKEWIHHLEDTMEDFSDYPALAGEASEVSGVSNTSLHFSFRSLGFRLRLEKRGALKRLRIGKRSVANLPIPNIKLGKISWMTPAFIKNASTFQRQLSSNLKYLLFSFSVVIDMTICQVLLCTINNQF